MQVTRKSDNTTVDAYFNDGADDSGALRQAIGGRDDVISEVGMSPNNGRIYVVQVDDAAVVEKGQWIVFQDGFMDTYADRDFQQLYTLPEETVSA